MKFGHISVFKFDAKKEEWNTKLFLFFCFAFFISVVSGTLSHEFGHILVAKILGYKTKLYFDSMIWYKNNIDENLDYPIRDKILVTLGGIGMTALLGSIGFIFLQKRKTKYDLSYYGFVFLALFGLRFIVNLLTGFALKMSVDKPLFGGDERKLSEDWGLYSGFFGLLLAGIAVLICGYVFLFHISAKKEFILAGIVGGIGGFILWFGFLGKLIFA